MNWAPPFISVFYFFQLWIIVLYNTLYNCTCMTGKINLYWMMSSYSCVHAITEGRIQFRKSNQERKPYKACVPDLFDILASKDLIRHAAMKTVTLEWNFYTRASKCGQLKNKSILLSFHGWDMSWKYDYYFECVCERVCGFLYKEVNNRQNVTIREYQTRYSLSTEWSLTMHVLYCNTKKIL